MIVEKKIFGTGFLLWLSTFFVFGLLAAPSPQIEPKPLHYDLEVNAQLVPIFAVDKNGNPVYDLKKEEIELYINKKPCNILHFMSYQVIEEKADTGKKSTGDIATEPAMPLTPEPIKEEGIKEKEGEQSQQQIKIIAPERVKFIIIDGISNSISGVRNAKKLAEGLIKAGGPGDAFILMQADNLHGFQYIIGPEKDKIKLLQTIETIYKDPSWIMMIKQGGGDGMPEYAAQMNAMSSLEQADAKFLYRSRMNKFSGALQDLKYALKTIPLPKTIFLISGGIQEIVVNTGYRKNLPQGAAYNYSNLIYYYENMRQATIDINKGGSLLYLVNPIPETDRIRRAVQVMSSISNAKCMYGPDVEKVLSQVKNHTAAYYEVSFNPDPKWGENFKIKVKCKRPDVTLNTLQYGEKSKPYAEMEETQKKLFALNVVTGGSWSRMVGKVQPAAYQKLLETPLKKIMIKKINLTIPGELKGKKLDVYVLNVDPKTLKADIKIDSPKTTDTGSMDLEVNAQPGKDQYVVIVEPGNTHCLFTRIS